MSDLEAARRVLVDSHSVAVLGAHVQPSKAAHYVPAYLAGEGYRILPVNPQYAGEELWGEPVRASLAELAGEPIDVIDVFRRSDRLAEHLPEILAMHPLPKVVWLQLSIRDARVEAALQSAGIEVIADRCMLADHKRLRLGARSG